VASNRAIYLAGGFKSGWQDFVRGVLNGWQIIDPSSHGLPDPKEYTEWDLRGIRSADVILAYMERDNPGGYSLALEVGYAKALGKHIILVEEHPTVQRERYFAMVREVADLRFGTLEEALNHLKAIGLRNEYSGRRQDAGVTAGTD
jgi:Nucleoside 2-deoxyribosyltransferase like